MAQMYHILPSQLLQCSPGELYLNMMVSAIVEGDTEPAPARRGKRPPDDATFSAFLAELKAGRNGDG